EWTGIIQQINSNSVYQTSVIVCGVLFILIGLLGPYNALKKMKAARVISFQNPDGEVTVSLSAVEEYINKIAKTIMDIKEVKPRVSVNKKGINIITEVSISASANIPEVTERIQMEVRNRVQDMLGVEEKINMKMHIKKIAKGPKYSGAPSEDVPSQGEHVPYRDTR
ncbi:MAG: alkaline shock response membrane anchor protein AmaP, partial [Candidatus Omnitrophica bacterium]|nr:alkaline shock response membrane anchor protein AmaP [Candidatus Omnitrophota bacterium]